MSNKYNTGLLEDIRSYEDRARDFKYDEVVDRGSAPDIKWVNKKESEWKKYPIWSQNGSGACVAFSMTKLMCIEFFRKTGRWVNLSPAYFYRQRVNYPNGGMFTYNACDIAINDGTTLEDLIPSEGITEEEANNIKITNLDQSIAEAFAETLSSYVYLPNDVDKVAEVLEMGKAVAVSIFADKGEYRGKYVPEIINKDLFRENAPIRHKVTITDYYKDKKYGKVFVVEDSWGLAGGKGGRRLFTEEWFNNRVTDLVYLQDMNFNYSPSEEVKKPKFKQEMQFIENIYAARDRHEGQKSSVKELQMYLKGMGYFPQNIDCTGFYGSITANSVLDWQIDNQVDDYTTLTALKGHYFGPKSLEVINR